MIKILLAEDQVILRETLACTLNLQEDMEVVAAVPDASAGVKVLDSTDANLALLDVCSEDGEIGIECAKQIREDYPDVKVVIMTGMPEITFIEGAKAAGAHSFVYKNVGTEELIGVIRSTMNGYSTFPNEKKNILSSAALLTPTEINILRLVCEAKSRKEVAAELYMSESTVKRYISEILAKTGYDSILRLAVHAVSQGLIIPRRTQELSNEDSK